MNFICAFELKDDLVNIYGAYQCNLLRTPPTWLL